MSPRLRRLLEGGVLLASFAILYRHVIVKLVHDWATDDNYSHGFIIVPLALYFAWERRRRFHAAPMRPSLVGVALVIASIMALVSGVLGAEMFITRLSLLGTLTGSILFLE